MRVKQYKVENFSVDEIVDLQGHIIQTNIQSIYSHGYRMKKDNKSEAKAILRQKAEELIHRKSLKKGSELSDFDPMKLVHELEVYQIELELQNEELILAKEKAAKLATEKYAELYDFAPSGYFKLSKEGKIMELNLSGSQMLGKERSRLKNSSFGFFVSDGTKPIFINFLDKIFNSNKKESCEISLITNAMLPMEVQLSGIVTNNGEQSLITMLDITERKRAEESLRESERFLQETQIIAKLGTYTTDVVTGNWESSPVLDDIFGIDADFDKSVEGWISIIHPEWQKIMNDYFIEEVLGHKNKFDKEYKIIRQINNEERWVHGIGRLKYNDNDQPITMVGTIIDITERKQAEAEIQLQNAELQKINSEKDKFFSIIAHDLRSPFDGFLGLTELMAEGSKHMSLDDIQQIALLMRTSATNLFRLLGNLLEWSRMQRGLATFDPISFLLNSKIFESMALVREAANKKEITINYNLPDDLIVFADVNMFEGIIRNLVFNAVKFTPKGGSITVSAKAFSDDLVEICVKDSGIGMNKFIIDHLFRLDINTTRKGTEGEYSTGLGLILCKDFIERHGGKLWVESEEKNGSAFHFTLPSNRESKFITT